MKTVLAASGFALTLLVGGIANAADTPSTNASNTPASAKPAIANTDAMKAADELHHTNIRQELQDRELAKAGYTSVKITPSSFFIEAKDKQGNPVQMVIGPNSFTETHHPNLPRRRVRRLSRRRRPSRPSNKTNGGSEVAVRIRIECMEPAGLRLAVFEHTPRRSKSLKSPQC